MMRENVPLIVVAVAAVAIGLIFTFAAEIVEREPTPRETAARLASACEEELKHRLLSPSSYRRIEISSVETTPATFNEFRGRFDPIRIAADEAMIAGDEKLRELEVLMRDIFERERPVRVGIWLRYESYNAFGVMVQGATNCTRVLSAISGIDAPQSAAAPIYLDGKSNMEWAMSRR